MSPATISAMSRPGDGVAAGAVMATTVSTSETTGIGGSPPDLETLREEVMDALAPWTPPSPRGVLSGDVNFSWSGPRDDNEVDARTA